MEFGFLVQIRQCTLVNVQNHNFDVIASGVNLFLCGDFFFIWAELKEIGILDNSIDNSAIRVLVTLVLNYVSLRRERNCMHKFRVSSQFKILSICIFSISVFFSLHRFWIVLQTQLIHGHTNFLINFHSEINFPPGNI